MELHPYRLSGTWDEGWVLDKHIVSSECIGEDPLGRPQFDTVRTELGEKLFLLKYRGRTRMADEIAQAAAEFLEEQPWFSSVDIILPAPPSKSRDVQPTFLIAERIAKLCKKFYADDVLVKAEGRESKSLLGIQKRMLAGSVTFIRHFLRPCNILVVDDLYTSGATLNACVHALRKDLNTQKVYVLAITQTRPR